MIEGVEIKECKKVVTKDHNKKANGWIMEIVNILEPFMKDAPRPEQVYMTVCLPGEKKGLHVHKGNKYDTFCCVYGDARIVLYKDEVFQTVDMGEKSGFKAVRIPPGVAHGIKCNGNFPAYVISMPSEAYDPDEPNQEELNLEW